MDLYEKLENYLNSNQIDQFSNLFLNDLNEKFLNEFSWDLSLLFLNYLNKNDDDNNELVKQFNTHLCRQYGNPKELYLVYLENSEYFFKQDKNFIYLIDLIQILFYRGKSKFTLNSIEQFLTQINKYLIKLNNVNNINNTKTLSQSFNVYKRVIDFIQDILDDLLNNQSNLDNNKISIFNYFLISLFNKPFINNDYFVDLVDKIYLIISKLNNDLFKLINKIEFETNNLLDTNTCLQIDKLAISSFLSYLLNKQYNNLSYMKFPKVYQHFFLFNNFLPIILRLLNDTNNRIYLLNGLKSIEFLLNKFDQNSFVKETLELDVIIESIEYLFKISVYSQFEDIRKISSDLLKKYFERFDQTARLEFIKYFFNYYNISSSDSMNNYVISYLIYLFKEDLNENLNCNQFKSIFNLITSFKNDQVKIDLVHEASKVISTLNLIRFLLLKDRKNLTEIYTILPNNTYLNNIKNLVDFNKLSFENERRNVLNNSDSIEEINNDIKIIGLVNNKQLKDLTKEDKLKSIECSRHKIDMIESLLVRINEILNENK